MIGAIVGEEPTMYTLSVSTAGLWIAVNCWTASRGGRHSEGLPLSYKGCVSNIIYFGNHRGVRPGCGACANVVEAHIYKQVLWLLEA